MCHGRDVLLLKIVCYLCLSFYLVFLFACGNNSDGMARGNSGQFFAIGLS